MNFQQVLVALAFALLITGIVSSVFDMTGFTISAPEMQKGGAEPEPLSKLAAPSVQNAPSEQSLITPSEPSPISPMYTNDTFGWCNCTSCDDCTAALNDSENCTVGVQLTQNITATGTCIDNPANFTNKTFDCQGNSITGDGTGDGIYLRGQTNNTIQNCTLTNLSYGIHLYLGSNYNNLTHNTVYNNTDHGIGITLSSNNTILNNIAYNNTNVGILLFTSSNNNTLVNNTAYNNSDSGIFLSSSSNNTLDNNTAYNNTQYGIYIFSSNNNNLTNNIANLNGVGISLDTSSNNTITNNTANNNQDGISFYVAQNNTLTNNIVNNNSIRGIHLGYSAYNTFINNTANNTQYGIFLEYSSYSILINNTANNNIDGIDLYLFSSNSILINNTANNNSEYGIFTESSNNTITNNTANSNTNSGINLYLSPDNTLVDNTANNNGMGIYLYKSLNNSLTRCFVKNNTNGILVSVYPTNITNNNITNNTVGIWANTSALNVFYNNLWNNTNYSVENVNVSMNVSAATNWWNVNPPVQASTPPADVSDNVTVVDALDAPLAIDKPMTLIAPLNGSKANSNITFNISTNRNSTCYYSVTYGSWIMFDNTSWLNHSHALTTTLEGPSTYYLKCQNDVGESYENSTNITVDLTRPSFNGTKISNLNRTGIGIAWNTSENTTGTIFYDTSTAYGNQVNDTTFATTHTKHITSLTGGTVYYFKIRALDAVNNSNDSADYYFITENRNTSIDIPTNNTTVVFTNPNVTVFIATNSPASGRVLGISEMSINPTSPLTASALTYLNVSETGIQSILNWTLINYTYNESKITGTGINESSLRLYRFDGSTWQQYNSTNGGVDTGSNYVWANTTNFSYFAVGGLLSDGVACTGSGECGSGTCLADYDGVGSWCGSSSKCSHDGDVTKAIGTQLCYLNYSKRCEGGSWSSSFCDLGCANSTGLCITSTTPGNPGGGSPAGPGGTGGISTVHFWQGLSPAEPGSMEITNTSFSVRKVVINVNMLISGSPSLTVTEYRIKPSYVANLSDVYAYVGLSVSSLPFAYIDNATVEFEVNKSWVTNNGFSPARINLWRYVTNWTQLDTTKVDESTDKIKYVAITPGFSVFAISGKAVAGENETVEPYCGDNSCDANENCSNCSQDCGQCQQQNQTTNYCGDGICDSNENCTSCPSDCGACSTAPAAVCGNTFCEAGEDINTCPADCTTEEAQPSGGGTSITTFIIIGGVAGGVIAFILVFWFVIKPRMFAAAKVTPKQAFPEYKPEVTYLQIPTRPGPAQPGAVQLGQVQPGAVQPQKPVTTPDATIVNYIQRQMQRGVPPVQIRDALLKAGWNSDKVIEAFKRFSK